MVPSEGDYEVNVGESVFYYLAAWFDEYCRGCGFEDRWKVFFMCGGHILKICSSVFVCLWLFIILLCSLWARILFTKFVVCVYVCPFCCVLLTISMICGRWLQSVLNVLCLLEFQFVNMLLIEVESFISS